MYVTLCKGLNFSGRSCQIVTAQTMCSTLPLSFTSPHNVHYSHEFQHATAVSMQEVKSRLTLDVRRRRVFADVGHVFRLSH